MYKKLTRTVKIPYEMTLGDSGRGHGVAAQGVGDSGAE